PAEVRGEAPRGRGEVTGPPPRRPGRRGRDVRLGLTAEQLPTRKWAATSLSTWARSSGSAPQAPAMEAARSGADSISMAAQKMVSSPAVGGVMGSDSGGPGRGQCEFTPARGSPNSAKLAGAARFFLQARHGGAPASFAVERGA